MGWTISSAFGTAGEDDDGIGIMDSLSLLHADVEEARSCDVVTHPFRVQITSGELLGY